MYYVYGLEYLGRKVNVKGQELPVEAKRFVILEKSANKPTEGEVKEMARESPGVRKAWVMSIEGNRWRKVMNPLEVRARDIVCGCEIDIDRAEKAIYRGKTYHFCSTDCKSEFEVRPEKYA